VKNVTDLAYIAASVQSAQTEVWSLYRPPFNQLMHCALLECSPSVKQVLLQLWQNEVTSNTSQNAVVRRLKMMNTMARVQTARFAIYELDAQ